MMERRGFLAALLAAFVARRLPAEKTQFVDDSTFHPEEFSGLAIRPKVWGDGTHDDTAAIQWYVDHSLPIPCGERAHFLIRDTVIVRPGKSLICDGGYWDGRGLGERPVICIESAGDAGGFCDNVIEFHS